MMCIIITCQKDYFCQTDCALANVLLDPISAAGLNLDSRIVRGSQDHTVQSKARQGNNIFSVRLKTRMPLCPMVANHCSNVEVMFVFTAVPRGKADNKRTLKIDGLLCYLLCNKYRTATRKLQIYDPIVLQHHPCYILMIQMYPMIYSYRYHIVILTVEYL